MQPTERMTDEELLVLCALADEIARNANFISGWWRDNLTPAEARFLALMERLELWTPPEGY